MFWGLSDALDLLSEYFNIFSNDVEQNSENTFDNPCLSVKENGNGVKKEINILLFGSNDPRHVIKTMAKIFTYESQGMTPMLNFYFVDGCVEVLARNLLLLGIALENPDALNLRTKVNLFIDVYGNSVIRSSSHHYLVAKAKSLIKIITDDAYRQTLAPFLNFNGIKYRERDGLENAFEFWLAREGHIFDIKECWNARLRKEMGVRFDYREGQFDWDLNMVLKERGGKQICSQEYRYWRETGIAFTFPEYEYSKPNPTLAAGLVRNGNKFMHRGYIGDNHTGPFCAFGLKTSDKRMHECLHGENSYRSTDVTERNLLEIFHELETQTLYVHDDRLSHKYGAVRLQINECLVHHEHGIESIKQYDKPWIFLNGVSINFLSSNDVLSLQQISTRKWSRFFDVAFVSHNYFTFLQDSFINVLNQDSVLILETKQLSTSRKEELNKFEDQLLNYAKRNNFQKIINYKAINSKNFVLKFKRCVEQQPQSI